MPIRITSKAAVKDLIGKVADTDDDVISSIVENVTAEFETYLDRQIIIETNKVEFFDVSRGQLTFGVKAFPITSVTNVWNDTERAFGSSTIVDSTNYYVDLIKGLIKIDKQWVIPGPGVLKIQYTGGMASNVFGFQTAFPDIYSAATREVAYRYQRKIQSGLIAATVPGGSVTLAQRSQFLPEVQSVLDGHLRYWA